MESYIYDSTNYMGYMHIYIQLNCNIYICLTNIGKTSVLRKRQNFHSIFVIPQ